MRVLEGRHQEGIRLARPSAATIESLSTVEIQEGLLLGERRVRAVELKARLWFGGNRAQSQ